MSYIRHTTLGFYLMSKSYTKILLSWLYQQNVYKKLQRRNAETASQQDITEWNGGVHISFIS